MLAGIVAVGTMGRWMLGPLDDAARNRRYPVQFTLSDFLTLVFLLQIPLGIVHSTMPYTQWWAIALLDAFGWTACSLIWWGSVRTLSRAGIHRPGQRFLLTAICIPFAYFGTFAIPLLVIALSVAWYAPPQFRSSGHVVSLVALLILDVCLLLLAGRYIRFSAGQVTVGRRPPHEPTAAGRREQPGASK